MNFRLTSVVQKRLCLSSLLSLLIATAIAGAQSSAGQVCLGALAESPACALATTFDELVIHAFDASHRVDQVSIRPSEDMWHARSGDVLHIA